SQAPTSSKHQPPGSNECNAALVFGGLEFFWYLALDGWCFPCGHSVSNPSCVCLKAGQADQPYPDFHGKHRVFWGFNRLAPLLLKRSWKNRAANGQCTVAKKSK